MTEEWSTVSDKSNLKTIAILLIAIIGIGSVAALALSTDGTELKQTEKPRYTTSYTNITAEEAKQLTDNNINLIIVDIRGCDCDYEEGHIPTAIWQTYAPHFYEESHDLIIYDQSGEESESYCQKLIGHTYGEIYYLEGGIDTWENTGYPTEAL